MPVVEAFEARSLDKRYGAVHALRGLSMTAASGEILGVVGDNGAGKSTLVRILAGVEAPDSGELVLGGNIVEEFSPQAARDRGVGTVFQDLALCLSVSISDNLFMGSEMVRARRIGGLSLLNRKAMRAETRRVVSDLGVDIDPNVSAAALSGGQRQVIAVARMLLGDRKVALMDEPTAALSVRNRGLVDRTIRRLADSGVCVVVVGHNLPELMELVDRVVVLRLGEVVWTGSPSDVSPNDLLRYMTMGGLEE